VIATDERDGVTVVTLNHGAVNALDLELCEAIADTMRELSGPVVMTGAGRAFSAGVDLARIVDGGAADARSFMTALSAAFLSVFDYEAPVVAAVNGHAIAGGCVIAQAADHRLMSAGTIGVTELAVGVPYPSSALEICRYRLGTLATRAVLYADAVGVDDAVGRGFVDEVCDAGELIDRACSAARRMGGFAPHAYAMTKRALHRDAMDVISASASYDARVVDAWASDETREQIVTFMAALHRR
jgi:enoyl-CoA hydratase